MIIANRIKFIVLLSLVVHFLIFLSYSNNGTEIVYTQIKKISDSNAINKNITQIAKKSDEFEETDQLWNTDDEKNVINPHDFKYMINPGRRICGHDNGKNITLMAMIPISAESFSHRFIIRTTWASRSNYPNDMRIVFLIGNNYNDEINAKIRFTYLKYRRFFCK